MLLLYPRDLGTVVHANPDVAAHLYRAKSLKRDIKAFEAELDMHVEHIKLAMGPAGTLMLDGRPAATWKAHDDTRLDQARLKAERPEIYEAFQRTKSVRVLRIK
jgi:predicted phage-related endonuclease